MSRDPMDDMVAGYLAGHRSGSDELPECHKAKSVAFRHGWLNGLDDRVGTPREPARVLRARADMIVSARSS
jgi:hypothetical protein